MPVFVVSICTHGRSAGLLDCLASLARQEPEPDSEVKLVVVENDLAPSSQGAVEDFSKTSPFKVHYAYEPRTGIPYARNRALEEAIRHGADWIIFIDDDEVAEPGWLAAFQEIARSNAAQVVVGPVHMEMPQHSPTWLAIDDKVPNTNRPLKRASTANVMLDAAIVRSGLRFDESMRFTGDSDTDFFTRAARAGARIVGDLRPGVRERVPASRLTFRAMCLRGMRVGRNYLVIHRKLDGIKGVVLAVLPKVLGHLIEGVAALLLFLAWLPFDRRRAKVSITKSITRFCWVVGSRRRNSWAYPSKSTRTYKRSRQEIRSSALALSAKAAQESDRATNAAPWFWAVWARAARLFKHSIMCGVAGVWRHGGGEVEPAAVTAMLDAIAHRGPDDEGQWQEGGVALGSRRLAIMDLSHAAHQPAMTSDGRGILVYNGEVYNYRHLRLELEREGAEFRSSGDTEVVLQALHRWGPERSLPRFDGMFALAYLDRRDNALWLARDRLGIKPLVVADTGTELLFASEIRALLAHPRMERRIDMHQLFAWVLGRGLGTPKSLFSGVTAVEPGCWWMVTRGGIEKRRYFHILDAIDVERLAAAGEGAADTFVGGFRQTMRDSVRLHIQSDAPLATMCSGGVDSSLVTAYAREQAPEIHAYVAAVEGREGEGDQAEAVGRHLGVPVHRVPFNQSQSLTMWPRVVLNADRPPAHPSDAALLLVAETCRADGIKVLLTGEGSDELFGGYPWQRATYKQWRRLTSWRRYLHRGRNLRRRLAQLEEAPFTIMNSRRDSGLRRRVLFAIEPEGEILSAQLLQLLQPIEAPADRAFLAACMFDLYYYLPWILYRHDRMGMAASMEMRVPFIENNVIGFALHLPRHAKLHGRVGKYVVKQAAAEVLPASIVHAPKKGFPVPDAYTLGAQHLLAGGLLADTMEWSTATTDFIVSILADDAYLRFQLVGLELWLRLFFDGQDSATLGERLSELARV